MTNYHISGCAKIRSFGYEISDMSLPARHFWCADIPVGIFID